MGSYYGFWYVARMDTAYLSYVKRIITYASRFIFEARGGHTFLF